MRREWHVIGGTLSSDPCGHNGHNHQWTISWARYSTGFFKSVGRNFAALRKVTLKSRTMCLVILTLWFKMLKINTPDFVNLIKHFVKSHVSVKNQSNIGQYLRA